jgi:hypothetical protein
LPCAGLGRTEDDPAQRVKRHLESDVRIGVWGEAGEPTQLRIAQPATCQPEPRRTGPGIGYDPAGSRFHRDTHSVMVTVPEPDGKAQHAAGRSRAEPACRPGRHHQGTCRNSISSPDPLRLPSLGRTECETQRHEPARQPEGRCIGRTRQSPGSCRRARARIGRACKCASSLRPWRAHACGSGHASPEQATGDPASTRAACDQRHPHPSAAASPGNPPADSRSERTARCTGQPILARLRGGRRAHDRLLRSATTSVRQSKRGLIYALATTGPVSVPISAVVWPGA